MTIALRKHSSSSRGNVAIFLLALVAVLGLMIGSVFYPFPSGHAMDVTGFIKLWLRELIFLGIAVLAIIVAGVSWFRRYLKHRHRVEHNAP